MAFRNSPGLLGYWVDQCASIALQSADAFDSTLAANSALSSRHPEAFSRILTVPAFELTQAFQYDRRLYAEDLVAGTEFANTGLISALRTIREALSPDVVISWSENRYLRHVFGDVRVLFMELGPLPRSGLKLSAHLDPFGHQSQAAIDRLCRSGVADATGQALLESWDAIWKPGVAKAAGKLGADAWLGSLPPVERTVLLALQPQDWITYEGLGQRLDPPALIAQVSRKYGPTCRILPTWHPAAPPPNEEILSFVQAECGNVVVPPPHLRIATSEIFLPFADVVTTVSSNVAVAAAIEGKSLDILNPGKFSSLATSEGHRRGDLLAFLLCRFCRPLEEWTSGRGAFAHHLGMLLHDPDWLFSPIREEEMVRLNDFVALSAVE